MKDFTDDIPPLLRPAKIPITNMVVEIYKSLSTATLAKRRIIEGYRYLTESKETYEKRHPEWNDISLREVLDRANQTQDDVVQYLIRGHFEKAMAEIERISEMVCYTSMKNVSSPNVCAFLVNSTPAHDPDVEVPEGLDDFITACVARNTRTLQLYVEYLSMLKTMDGME